MTSFLSAMKELMFRFKLFMFGIRFYQCVDADGAEKIYEAEYRLDYEHSIHFIFYSQSCVDIVLKRGELCRDRYNSYIVQAKIDSSFPESVREYNGKFFFFNATANAFRKSEQKTVELILDVYLDFLKTSIENCDRCKKGSFFKERSDCKQCRETN